MRVTPQIPPRLSRAGGNPEKTKHAAYPTRHSRAGESEKAASGVGTRFFKDLLLMDIDGFHHVALLDG